MHFLLYVCMYVCMYVCIMYAYMDFPFDDAIIQTKYFIDFVLKKHPWLVGTLRYMI